MNFVESLSMFYVDAKEIPCVTEKGAPTEKTLGAPGVLYMDTDTGALYKCRAADYVNELYTWESVEAGGSSDETITLTDNEALKIGPEGQMLSQEGSTNHIISQSIPVSAGERYRLTCSANFGNSLYAIYSGEADRANLLKNLTADATQEGDEIIAQEVVMPTGAKCMIVAWNKLVTDTPYAVVRVSQSAQATPPLAGQTVVVIGDSVVEDNNKASVNFCDHLAVNTGAEIVNMGVGGTGYMAGADESKAFYQRAEQIPDGTERVLIYGSGNDRDMKLGTPADTGTDTLCGCINATIDAVYERVPTAWVGIIAPAPWRYYPPSDGDNAMALMVQAQQRICARRGIPFLDLYHASGLRPWDDTFRELAFDTEGVHPNDTGHALIAPQIQAFLLGAVGGGAVASVPDSEEPPVTGNGGTVEIVDVIDRPPGSEATLTETEDSTPDARKYILGVPSGAKGASGVGISETIVSEDEDARETSVSIAYNNGESVEFTIPHGKNGKDGADGMSATHEWDGTVLKVTSASGTSSVDLKGEPGNDGSDGQPGKDGTSTTHSWNGTVLTITSASGTSSADLKGAKGDKGDTGATGSAGKDGADGKDYSFDPTVYGLPVLYLTGDTSPIAVSKDNKVTLAYAYGDRAGSCTLKGQGATSYKTAQALVNAGKAGKFNYTINFDHAFEAKSGWGAQKKYCLKANFIDPTHTRNIGSCTLWGMSVKSRSTVPTELADLPNGGAIDGFPIIIMLNGEFHGLYTWNIPKDGWMFGLVEDSSKTQAIVGADDHTSATQFKEASMTGFEVEFVSDEDNADWVEQSLTRMISAVMNSDGSDMDTTVAQYLDWDSVIDHYIHTVVDKATDCVDKNFLLVTFDGVKWYMSAYDRDSIHGLNWDASGTTRPVSNCSFVECADTVRVYELVKRFKTNALKARYKELRGSILSESRIMQIFENFAWPIPSPVMLEDVKLYPTIKGSGVNTIDQIGRFVRQRLAKCDEWIDALPGQETPSGSGTVTTYAVTNKLTNCVSSNGASAVNAGAAYSAMITASDGYALDGATVSVTMGGTDITSTAYSNGSISIASVTGAVVITVAAVKKVSGYTNLVTTSTDVDGSVYNGTGYKDNARLSSSGGVSGTAQNGSVVTGFIPFKNTNVIRMKGATWTHRNGEHYYFSLYSSGKTLVSKGYASAEAWTGDAAYQAQLQVTYDAATGVTTFQMIDPTGDTGDFRVAAQNAAYFRINAYGKGADLIVTVNEEIT